MTAVGVSWFASSLPREIDCWCSTTSSGERRLTSRRAVGPWVRRRVFPCVRRRPAPARATPHRIRDRRQRQSETESCIALLRYPVYCCYCVYLKINIRFTQCAVIYSAWVFEDNMTDYPRVQPVSRSVNAPRDAP